MYSSYDIYRLDIIYYYTIIKVHYDCNTEACDIIMLHDITKLKIMTLYDIMTVSHIMILSIMI